jgi:hypothetical protein
VVRLPEAMPHRGWEGVQMGGAELSRRAFLGRGAAMAAAGAAVAVVGNAAMPAIAGADEKTFPTFALTPNGGACGACQKHAANKVFRTSDAAERLRAHKGCRCTIIAGPALTPPIHDAVFRGTGEVADRRDPRVAEILDKGTINGVPVPVLAIGAPIILGVGGGLAYWFWRRHERTTELATAPVDRGEWK